MTTNRYVQVECPVCEAPGEVLLVLETVPGRDGWSVDDVPDVTLGCTCLESPFTKHDDIRDALIGAARKALA